MHGGGEQKAFKFEEEVFMVTCSCFIRFHDFNSSVHRSHHDRPFHLLNDERRSCARHCRNVSLLPKKETLETPLYRVCTRFFRHSSCWSILLYVSGARISHFQNWDLVNCCDWINSNFTDIQWNAFCVRGETIQGFQYHAVRNGRY